MLRKFYILLAIPLVLAGLFFPASGHAQSSRIYFAGYMGLNTFSDQSFSESTAPQSGQFELSHSASFAGALGLRLNRNFRIETEASYQKTDLDRIKINGSGNFALGGDLESWILMLNGYYDFDLKWENIQPFLTVGIGLARHQGTIDNLPGVAIDASDTDLAPVWQLGGGLKYRINDTLALTGSYRYLGSAALDFGSYNMDFSSHQVRFGVEYDLPVRRGGQ